MNYQDCIESLSKDWCRKNYQAQAATFKEDFSTDNIKVDPFDKNATGNVLGQINTLHNQANAELLGQKRR